MNDTKWNRTKKKAEEYMKLSLERPLTNIEFYEYKRLMEELQAGGDENEQ
jgi:uncharacterized protein (DUF736 family)